MPDSSQFVDIGVARVDVGRHDRCGFPEVIFGPGKTPGDMVAIARMIVENHGVLLATRVNEEQITAMR
jgi:NCAIR mutase (PurE)-related protein